MSGQLEISFTPEPGKPSRLEAVGWIPADLTPFEESCYVAALFAQAAAAALEGRFLPPTERHLAPAAPARGEG